jgi:hypothetical protein
MGADGQVEDVHRVHDIADVDEHDVAETVGRQILGVAGLDQHRHVLKANMIVDVTPACTGRVALMAFVPRIGVPLVGA